MKRKLALFLALCTLSGCANNLPAEITASEITETTPVTTEITTAPPVTTTTKVTTAVTEKTPLKYEGDIPELTAKNIPYTVEKRVRIDDLLEQIDIKPQIDVTKLDGYESSVWFYENLATEEEKAYMTNNNYMRHFASLDYIGTELADWLLQIHYYFITDGETTPEYMRLFYVKDGVVTEELRNIDFERYDAVHSDNTTDCIYMSTWNNGIYEFNKHTGALDNIISIDEWADVFTIDEKYLFFRAENCLQIYDRKSGKVTKTDIYEGMHDGTRALYNGEVLYYSEDNKYYCYDIATGVVSELSEFGVAAANRDYPWYIIGNSQIGKYHINTKYRTDKLVSMTVTVRESGTQRNYIFEEIAQNFLNDGCVRANLRGEAYGMLCFTIDTYTGSYLFLLDPERNTIQYFNADETDTFFLSAIADTLICYTDSGYYTVVPEITVVPEVTFNSNVSIEKSFIHSDIETQLRTEKPVDVSVYDWYDEIRAEAEEKGGEEAENAKKNNYTSIHIFNSEFIGNEKADWIVSALYYPCAGGLIPPFLSRIFYVKDGKITQYLAKFDNESYITSHNGRIFVSAYNDGIYELNLKTDKLEKIVDAEIVWERPHQNFCRCLAATSEYMIYKDAEECLKIYYFDSGKIFKTDIYSGWQDGQAFGIHGDSLIYMPMNTDSNEYAELDIMTGELVTSDISYEEFRNLLSDFKNESDSHLIKPFYPYNGLPDIITVKSKADGKTKKFDIKTVLEQLGYKLYSFYALGVDGDKLYCYSSSEKCCLVINLSQDTMRFINLEGSRYSISVSFDSSQIEVYDGEQNYILNINPPSLSDENGLLTEDYAEQIDKLMSTTAYGHPFAALQDFNGDDFPEIVVIEHNGGQGLMPCKIYDAETLEYMGEFMGFCRDGFTNFYETADSVVVYNYYEHSVHSRYEGYSLIENVDGIFTERIVSSETGIFNACGAYNAGIVWENSAGYKGIRYEAEGYSVSTFGYDIHATEAGKFLVDFYNNCRQIENIFNKKVAELESFSVFYKPLLAIGDYDMDGKPEAFFQLGINKPLSFIDSELNVSEVELSDPSSDSYNASSAYKLWNGIIVFQGMGNSEPCLIYTVNNGKPEEITELSGKGMQFNYSRMYNGCYELYDSEYDGPYHTWKPYTYYCDKDGWHEYGSIEITTEEFLDLYGNEAQEIFDRIAATETPVENSGSWEIRSILYRSDNTYIINYGWDIRNEHIVVKPGITENDRLIEYPDYGGVYATAFIPELAVYPDSTHPDFDF